MQMKNMGGEQFVTYMTMYTKTCVFFLYSNEKVPNFHSVFDFERKTKCLFEKNKTLITNMHLATFDVLKIHA